MSSLKPRLERIAELRQRERDRAAGQLVAARAAVQAAQGQLAELQRYAAEYSAKPLAQSAWQIQARRAFVERLELAEQQQQQQIARAERQTAQAQRVFQEAQMVSQSLHRAADRQREQMQQERDRRQQAIDDDRGVGMVTAWGAGG